MAEHLESPSLALEAALIDLKAASARRRIAHRGSPEYGEALAAEMELSEAVYELALALRRSQAG
jgi:hypothetical protein